MPNAESFDATIRSVASASSRSARQRVALDRRDQRLGRRPFGEPHAAALDDDVLAARERLEVHPRAERAACTGQDADREAVLGVQAVHGVRQSPADRGVDRVLRLRAVDGDDQDPVALFDQDNFFALGFFAHVGDASDRWLPGHGDWVLWKTRTRSNSTGGPMATTDIEPSELTKWDPGLTERVMGITRPFLKRYFRSEVRGLENMPPGGALLVSNHSGGMLPMDVPILSADFYHQHGYERPLYTLSHDMLMMGPTGDFFKKIGYISANHENADEALRSGGLVVVFPGGDYDVYRPTLSENKIDFGGRTGYIKAALNAGVPIVPTVGIGGQETQLYLTRGTWLAKRLGPIARLARAKIVPISFGFPFGLSVVVPPNFPLPAKIVMEVLPPIDIVAEFGEDPDIDEVDAHVRHVMQRALDELAAERRLPVLG